LPVQLNLLARSLSHQGHPLQRETSARTEAWTGRPAREEREDVVRPVRRTRRLNRSDSTPVSGPICVAVDPRSPFPIELRAGVEQREN
jgi:hypothetical protein